MLRSLALGLTALLLVGCASSDADPVVLPPTDPVTTEPWPADLTISVTAIPDGPAAVTTLTCEPTGGDHPDPAGACAYLEQASATGFDPFAPVPDDVACTEIYGGSAVATVTGTWGDRAIDAEFSLVNGCEIDRWGDATALLGSPPEESLP